MEYKPEKIEGISSKSYDELRADLRRILEKAEADANALQTEIADAYEKKGQAEAEMRKAAGAQNMEAYKEARLEFDMQSEFIAQAETVHANLVNDSLISREDRGAIRRRIAEDQYHATGAAALKIKKLMHEIEQARDELHAQINAMNSVIVQLNITARTKDEYGSPYINKGIVRDEIIAPYVGEINPRMGLQLKSAAFKHFSDNYKGEG